MRTIFHIGFVGLGIKRNVGRLPPSITLWLTLSVHTDIGKLYNGHSLLNYSPAPKGWDHIDILVPNCIVDQCRGFLSC